MGFDYSAPLEPRAQPPERSTNRRNAVIRDKKSKKNEGSERNEISEGNEQEQELNSTILHSSRFLASLELTLPAILRIPGNQETSKALVSL